MNREIKFRAWLPDMKQIGPVTSLKGSNTEYKFFRAVVETFDAHKRQIFYETSDFVLMQFTGLKDKNGKEIYEGDIVELRRRRSNPEAMTEDDYDHFYTRGIVEFSSACFWINGGGYSELQHFHFNDTDRKVIGNIYQDAHLLNP